jgi:polyhydroxybutyrate depolymerase
VSLGKRIAGVAASALAALLLTGAVNGGLVMWGPSQNGTSESLVVDGLRRDYLLHVPDDLPAGDVPLVLVLHGAYGWGDQIARATDFSRKADAEGFIVAYPEGHSAIPRIWQFWNATYCCYGAMDGPDDVAFLDALITHLADELPIDPSRVYLAGFSNGGMLAAQYAARHTDRIAALATVSSTIGANVADGTSWRIPEPSAPLPVFAMHGLRDRGVPWDGSASVREPTWAPMSLNESVGFWLDNNAIAGAPSSVDSWADGNIVMRTWSGGRGGSEVRELVVHDAGHSWPGGDGAPFFAQPTKDADATGLVWEFFASHQR